MNRLYSNIGISLIVSLFIILLSQSALASRAIRVQLKNNKGAPSNQVQLYGGSYALLIGASNYTAGWPSLESIPGELAKVEKLLSSKGFVVENHQDPDHKQLHKIFINFIRSYGYNPQNRLLFYFSGHGHTRKDGRKGYLVPVDAPNPNVDEIGFVKKSLGMNQIISWSRDIEAKHVLFLFDSCFSGTIFKQKELPAPPKYITTLTTQPVRQFITAGSAGEAVPANSTFTPAFIDALLYNLADLNEDGYVSGTELGLYLQAKVPQHADQSPQFGKIGDYDLSRGDFIFLAGGNLNESTGDAPKNYKQKIKTGSLKITSVPSGSKVTVDGKPAGRTPVQLSNMVIETVKVSVSQKGYLAEEQQVLLKEGRLTTVNFTLEQKQVSGRLTVRTTPHNARVQILNVAPSYRPDMKISAGRYHIEVSAPGYQTEKRWIKLVAGGSLTVNFRLEHVQESGRLTVRTTPGNAKIQILNIGPSYSPGMKLSAGRYHIKVSAPGYQTEKRWVSLVAGGSLTVNFRLEQVQVRPPKQETVSPSPPVVSKPSIPFSAREIRREGRFIAYKDNTVKDTQTGLMWAARDNGKDINWNDAKRYCENYRGGGYTDWRMPSQLELAELYREGIFKENKPGNQIIKLTKLYVWASEKRGSKAAFFYFDDGIQLWFNQTYSYYLRTLPVRRGN